MQQQLQALFLQCALGGSPYGALLHQNQQQQQQTQTLQSLQHLSLQPHTLGALAGLVGGADGAGGLGGAAGSAGISGISSSLFDQVNLISLLQQQQQHQQQQYVQQQQVQAQQAQVQQQEGVAATRQVPDQLLQIQQEMLLRQILQSVTPAQMQVCSISPISCTGVTQTISRLLRISTSLQDQVHKQLPQTAIQKNGERLISHADIRVKFLVPRPEPLFTHPSRVRGRRSTHVGSSLPAATDRNRSSSNTICPFEVHQDHEASAFSEQRQACPAGKQREGLGEGKEEERRRRARRRGRRGPAFAAHS